VVPAWWYWDRREQVYRSYFTEPYELTRGGRLRDKAEAAMRDWASQVDRFIRAHPEMWWNWLDKRWTRIIREGK
jgi:predicted LPLAT superfamily acyltransferase